MGTFTGKTSDDIFRQQQQQNNKGPWEARKPEPYVEEKSKPSKKSKTTTPGGGCRDEWNCGGQGYGKK